MSRRKKIIIANWKMNPASLSEALDIFNKIKSTTKKVGREVVVCPPFLYLTELRKAYNLIGAQDVSYLSKGSHTGEISPKMLALNGIKYVIIGHSERRALGETDEVVNKKIAASLSENLKVILCVGESDRDERGEYLNFIKNQLRNSLKRINRKYLKNLIVAYEPLFTIGEKNFKAMSSHDIHQMVIFIRRNLIDHFADRAASNVPIVYGGSVSDENAGEIAEKGAVDGFLVGRQSLRGEQFKQIIRSIK